MGCPPSPEEKDMARYSSMIDDALNVYNKMKFEYERFFRLVTALESVEKDAALLSELQEISKNNILAHNIPERMDVPTPQGESEFYSWLGELGSTALSNKEKVHRLETSLCNARCLFYAFTKHYTAPDEQTNKEIAFQLNAYKKHREEDRQTWLSWLREERSHADFYLENGDKHQIEMAKHTQQVLDNEISRTENHSEEAMMTDCFLFGRDAERFDFFNIFFGGKRAD